MCNYDMFWDGNVQRALMKICSWRTSPGLEGLGDFP